MSGRASGVDALFGLVGIVCTLVAVLAAVDDWNEVSVGLFAFMSGLGFGWCFHQPARDDR